MPAPTSAVEFLELVKKSGLVEPDSYTQVTEATLPPDPSQAASVFIKRGWLTNFQAKQLLAGRYRGFRIGAYIVREQLGQGGMGIVYLAEHEQLRRRVALKVLTGSTTDGKNVALERFLREARAAAALDHPNIVRIHDVGQNGAVHFLVMEFVEGKTFDTLLSSSGPVSAGRAVGYIAQAAAGLLHAHEKGFVHRDIKPGNLMLTGDGSVKILDMGLARSFDNAGDRLTEQFDAGAVVGTADFISPEQALNDPNIDHRADIYSLGATFYALITGQPPFTGNTTQKLMQHQMREAPPLTSVDKTFPQGLSDVIARMMAKQANKRYESMTDVIEALAPWMPEGMAPAGGTVVRSRSTGSLPATAGYTVMNGKSGKKKGLPKWALALTGAAGFAGLVGAVVWSSSQPKMLQEQMGTTVVNNTQPTTKATTPAPKANTPAASKNNNTKAANNTKPQAAKGITPPGEPTRAAFRTDLTSAKSFLARVVCEGTEADKVNRTISQSGEGLPAGWESRVWRSGATAEFLVSDETGTPALGIRTIAGRAGGMVFLPEFSSPAPRATVTFEYRASKPNTVLGVKFRAQGAAPSASYFVGKVTAGAGWKTATLPADLRGATGGRFEFQNEDDEPDATVWVKNVAVLVPDVQAVPETKPHFSFDPATLTDFRVRKVKHTVTTGSPPSLPAGVGVTCWKDEAEGEFWRDLYRDQAVLGLANLTAGDLCAAQLGVELEASAGVTLQEGKKYKLVVTYSTTGTGHGNVYFQFSDYSSITGQKELPNTGGEWKTVESVVTRTDKALRFLVDTKASGLENALLIRGIKVVEE